MSSITWDGNRLIQRVASQGREAELGYVASDDQTGGYVLWLKDLFGNGYVRADEFASLGQAKQRAASTVSADLLHGMWSRRKNSTREVRDWVKSDDSRGVALTKEFFVGYMRKDRRFRVLIAILSAALALLLREGGGLLLG